MYRKLVLLAACLALVVIVVGAYVRLEDAGLGCPDWPGCYGQLIGVPEQAHEVAKAEQAFPGKTVDVGRARTELFHRYLAGTLGLLILAIAALAWRRRDEPRQSPWLATALVVLVAFQATLGKWTVTMLLKPAIVTAHLLGGMAALALLVWFSLERFAHAPAPETRALRLPALLALLVVGMQIALGGWVSANYAALACPDLPLCLGEAAPPMDFANAFHVLRELGQTGEGELLPREALTAIHWSHRVFALVVLVAVGWVALKAFRLSKPLAVLIAALLVLQLSLGVANVALSLPLALAAAHNAGAALLLASLVVLNFFAFRGLRPSW
jgi:cytochrome c oxidase assembly protein subunit 15